MFLMAFYCNPVVDSSFSSYSHFLQVAICLAAFLLQMLEPNRQGRAKEHSM